MGYSLHAFVGQKELLLGIAEKYQNARVAPLQQGIGLLLNTVEFWNELQSAQPDPFAEFHYLSAAIAELGSTASAEVPMAYVEAEFFGGLGTQAAILWQTKQVVFGPILLSNEPEMPKPPPLKDWPINSVLRLLGVVADEGKDEFETVGLHAHRRTEDWLDIEDADQNK